MKKKNNNKNITNKNKQNKNKNKNKKKGLEQEQEQEEQQDKQQQQVSSNLVHINRFYNLEIRCEDDDNWNYEPKNVYVSNKGDLKNISL